MMKTYMKAGMVHMKDDEEVGIEERRANQKTVNGAVSMLLKVFMVGKEYRHEGRWRESMISRRHVHCGSFLRTTNHGPVAGETLHQQDQEWGVMGG